MIIITRHMVILSHFVQFFSVYELSSYRFCLLSYYGSIQPTCSIHVQGICLVGENLFVLYADTKDTDQPAHMHRLIIAFVTYFLETILTPFSACILLI